MPIRTKLLLQFSILVLAALLSQPLSSQAPEAGSSGILAGGWLDEWSHRHFSPRGTPYVHLFNLEPAFLDRDLFVDYRHTSSEDETESEFELELEWAFTKRLGVAVELPLVHVDPDGEDTETGVGDFAIAPRALLVDTDVFLLSANLEVGVPTGDEDRDLGSGETMLAPSFSLWADLGNWISFQSQVGTEHGLDSGDTELSYKSALSWSFAPHGAQSSEPAHWSPGMTSLITELTGRTVLEGEARTTAELLFGVSRVLSGRWAIRGGFQFPVGGPEDIDYGFVLGVIHHF